MTSLRESAHDSDNSISHHRRTLQIVPYESRAAWNRGVGGAPSWCANFDVVDRLSFKFPKKVSVPAKFQGGNIVFDIFESYGPSKLANDNWFFNGEAQMFVDKNKPVIVDINFKEAVSAWGATFQRINTNELVRLRLDLLSTGGFGTTVEITIQNGFFGIISPNDGIERIRFEAINRAKDGEVFDIFDVCGKDLSPIRFPVS